MINDVTQHNALHCSLCHCRDDHHVLFTYENNDDTSDGSDGEEDDDFSSDDDIPLAVIKKRKLEKEIDSDDDDFELEHDITWKDPLNKLQDANITQRTTVFHIEDNGHKSELDFFFDYFPSNLICEIASNTNSYKKIYDANSNRLDRVPLNATAHDIKNYLSVRIVMSIVELPEINDYWAEDDILGNTFIKETMSRNKFYDIHRYFCVNDPNNDPKRLRIDGDPLYKVRNVYDTVRERCEKKLFNEHSCCGR